MYETAVLRFTQYTSSRSPLPRINTRAAEGRATRGSLAVEAAGSEADVDIGPLRAIDRRLAAFDPSAHLSDDLFGHKIAFVALLNFPLTTLEERLARGLGWTRRQWAETRLAQQFSTRVPASVNEAPLLQAAAAALDGAARGR